MFGDYLYNVTGILRKRSRHRCEKRGEDFEKYVEKIEAIERKIGKARFDEQMKAELKKPNWFSMIEKDSNWKGAYLQIPMILESAKRKRSNYRKNRK